MINLLKIIKRRNSYFNVNMIYSNEIKDYISSNDKLNLLYNKITNNSFDDYYNNYKKDIHLENNKYEERINNISKFEKLITKKELGFYFQRSEFYNLFWKKIVKDKILVKDKEYLKFYFNELIELEKQYSDEIIQNLIFDDIIVKSKKSSLKYLFNNKNFSLIFYNKLNPLSNEINVKILKYTIEILDNFNLNEVENISLFIKLMVKNKKNIINKNYIVKIINIIIKNSIQDLNLKKTNFFSFKKYINILTNLLEIADSEKFFDNDNHLWELINSFFNNLKNNNDNSYLDTIGNFNLKETLKIFILQNYIENSKLKSLLYSKIINKYSEFDISKFNWKFIESFLYVYNKGSFNIPLNIVNSISENKNIFKIDNIKLIYLILEMFYKSGANFIDNHNVILKKIINYFDDFISKNQTNNIYDQLLLLKSIYFLKEKNKIINLNFIQSLYSTKLILFSKSLEKYFEKIDQENDNIDIKIVFKFSTYMKKLISCSNCLDNLILKYFNKIDFEKNNINNIIIPYFDEILKSLEYKVTYNTFAVKVNYYNNSWNSSKLLLFKNLISSTSKINNKNLNILFLKLINLKEFFNEININKSEKTDFVNSILNLNFTNSSPSLSTKLSNLIIKSYYEYYDIIDDRNIKNLFRLKNNFWNIKNEYKYINNEFVYNFLKFISKLEKDRIKEFQVDLDLINKELKDFYMSKILNNLNLKSKIIYGKGVEQNFVKGLGYEKYKYIEYLLPILKLLDVNLDKTKMDIISLVFKNISKLVEGNLLIENINSLKYFKIIDEEKYLDNNKIIINCMGNFLLFFKYFPKKKLLIYDNNYNIDELQKTYYIFLNILYLEIQNSNFLNNMNLLTFSILSNLYFKNLKENDVLKVLSILGDNKNNYSLNLIKNLNEFYFYNINFKLLIKILPSFIKNKSFEEKITEIQNVDTDSYNIIVNKNYYIKIDDKEKIDFSIKIKNYLINSEFLNFTKFIDLIIDNFDRNLDFETKENILLLNSNLANKFDNINIERLKIYNDLINNLIDEVIFSHSYEYSEVKFEGETNPIKFNKIFENYEKFNNNCYQDNNNFKVKLYYFPEDYTSSYTENILSNTNYYENYNTNVNRYYKDRYLSNLFKFLTFNWNIDVIKNNNKYSESHWMFINEKFCNSQTDYFEFLSNYMKNSTNYKIFLNENFENIVNIENDYLCPLSNIYFNVIDHVNKKAFIFCDEYFVCKNLKKGEESQNILAKLLRKFVKQKSGLDVEFVKVGLEGEVILLKE